jgi:hypothetical protein
LLSLFPLSLKNTRIINNGIVNINQSLTGSCNPKTTTPAGRDSVGYCSIHRYARTSRQGGEARKQERSKMNMKMKMK